MGARGKNFYNNVFRRYGYEREAEQIQNLYLDGKKDEAAALVPDDYLEGTALVGDEGWVRERIQAYKAAGVTRLSVNPVGDDPLRLIEKVKAWAD
jgi:alkanesulfonate monooxygenase SsuD/methylene tetrahydromethanopterin reductase-like flavin-dependent oxidoreductase (luciferase family)